jgi:hypothetical protein
MYAGIRYNSSCRGRTILSVSLDILCERGEIMEVKNDVLFPGEPTETGGGRSVGEVGPFRSRRCKTDDIDGMVTLGCPFVAFVGLVAGLGKLLLEGRSGGSGPPVLSSTLKEPISITDGKPADGKLAGSAYAGRNFTR